MTIFFRRCKLVLFMVLCSFAFFSCNLASNSDDNNGLDSLKVEKDILMYGIKTNFFDVIQDKIARNKSLSQILSEAGLNQSTIASVVSCCDTIFDVRRIKAGNQFTMLYDTKDSVQELHYFIYEVNNVDYIVFDVSNKDDVKVYREKKPVQYVERRVKGQIESSLWNAMVGKGLSPALAVELSEMYAWTIDFFGLQKGDYFKIVFIEELIDSVSVGVKNIKYAVFNHQGKDFYAIPFEQVDGKIGFYDENGEAIKKAFLKAPLKFSRISSHFSHGRMHPVLKIVRPHHGVDYAAPVGTPVMSIGHGVVVKKGYSGGAGHMVRIKHNSVYSTVYMHLSKYGKGINDGARVQQGQIIGYVGSSGLSTGPHLDFRVYKNGKPINPLTMESPPAEPVNPKRIKEFNALKDSLVQILQNIQ